MRELEEALEESLKLSEIEEISEIESKMLELASKQVFQSLSSNTH